MNPPFFTTSSFRTVSDSAEEIDPELASLYIDEPKIFLGEDDELVQAIQNMHLSAQFSHQLNKVLNAVNDKKDFEADKAVLAEMKASEKNEDLFNLLALLCATSSYDNIPEELLPHNLFESQSKTSDAFLRYVNNYLAETNGMREARLKAVLYAGFIRNAMEDEKAPCIKDLIKMIGKKEVKRNSEDDMF
ncbi:PPPDE_peptidase domain-containing protein [Hexamita inflata]|uniref:PPPDE peptidase domain-containing protein n=1 Tax=Hexamita inflata TaxID=28002 RepID=A0AA86Q3M5_9EUKA|nr:PPPDE peptidase domain-containing protein [Hexamita inflata]